MSSLDLSIYDVNENRSYKPPKPEILTPLPLPGEYIVLQLNPAAMAKHYYEGISALKPWHMMYAYIYYQEPQLPAQTPTARNGEDEVTEHTPLLAPENTTNSESQLYSLRPVQLLDGIIVRIRTRLCHLPRSTVVEVPKVTYKDIEDRLGEGSQGLAANVDCRHFILERAPKSPCQTIINPTPKGKYNPEEWEAGSKPLQLCLLPHFDYSFDVDQEVSPGTLLMEEHTQIIAYANDFLTIAYSAVQTLMLFVLPLLISLMRAAIPELPIKAKIPVCYQYTDREGYYVEKPLKPNLAIYGVPEWVAAKSERARRRAKLHNYQSWYQRIFHPGERYRPTAEVATLMRTYEGFERPNKEMLLLAPPAILNGDVVEDLQPTTEPLLWDWLLDRWEDVKTSLAEMFWIPPAYPDPGDDAPHLPFARWEELVEEGKLKRWEEEPLEEASQSDGPEVQWTLDLTTECDDLNNNSLSED
ncbi:hypothetical protein BC835DRAFT_1303755 [Cytidiella melzeri]|nr:hypothetical protein BC835DRAFT_1303755 [Cytidiella melzeri]